MNFVFFMVKSLCVLAGCSNPGMLLTLHVSLSPASRTVKLDRLGRPLIQHMSEAPEENRRQYAQSGEHPNPPRIAEERDSGVAPIPNIMSDEKEDGKCGCPSGTSPWLQGSWIPGGGSLSSLPWNESDENEDCRRNQDDGDNWQSSEGRQQLEVIGNDQSFTNQYGTDACPSGHSLPIQGGDDGWEQHCQASERLGRNHPE